MPFRLFVLVSLIVSLLGGATQAAEFTVKQDDEGVSILLNGRLFTKYLIKSGAKPILWPVIGPTEKPITRGYPMREATPEERNDHIHHRSFWFTHGDVNGIDFWSENKGHGNIIQREFLEVKGGPTAVVSTRNDWVGPEGEKQCSDTRVYRFGADQRGRWIDCDITVTAEYGDVTFGDTKEGSFGVRLAGDMKVSAKKGGRIINSRGQSDLEAWGQPAEWVDYHGPVDGETVGVTIMNHPKSFRYPTRWHVRTYGLFTANVFGLHHFERSDKADGSFTLKKGESFVFRHRVFMHKGDEKQGDVAAVYAEYAKTP